MKNLISNFVTMNRLTAGTMTTLFFILASLISSGFPPINDYPGYKLVADLPAFNKKFVEAAAKVNTLNSDFTQEKHLSALTEKITSQGKLWFKRSNKVRMDYTSPFVYRMVMN